MKMTRTFSWFMIAALLAACASISRVEETLIPPSPTDTPITTIPTAIILPTGTPLPVLSEALLQNAAFHAPMYDRDVTLTGGSFEAPGELWVRLLPWMAFGDLNGDGLEDAAVMLAERGGGSGTFVSLLAMINQDGQPVQAAAAMIDDRPTISGVEIVEGRIVLKGAIHTASDPGCCPTLAVNQTYVLDGSSLILLHQVSFTESVAERSITITSPAFGSEVGKEVQIQGSMPIAPFENNLLYKVYDLSFNLLDAGAFAVFTGSGEMGGPAQFDNLVNSPAFIPGTTVWFELSENSMADGTPFAIERIKLRIK